MDDEKIEVKVIKVGSREMMMIGNTAFPIDRIKSVYFNDDKTFDPVCLITMSDDVEHRYYDEEARVLRVFFGRE